MRSRRDLILTELLVLRCRRRDPAAARELVRLFEPGLLYYLRRMLGSEADAWDVLQNTWMSVFRKLDRVKDPQAFAAYLYASARNHALAQLRKSNAHNALLASLDPPAEISGEGNTPDFTAEDAGRLHAALGELPLAHREVLTLFFLQELSIDEIATVVHVPPGTVKSRLHHAKRALRRILQEKGDENVD